MGRFVWVALALQVVMVVTGHFNEFVLLNLSAVLGVTIPLIVAYFYGRGVTGAKQGGGGGFVIGFVGAFVGVVLAILMGDQTLALLTFAPPSSGVTGAIGGALGAAMGRGAT